MRRSLRALLDATDGLRVVADAPDLDSAERLLAGAGADVFVLDLDRRGGSSGERVAVLRAHRPRTTVVAFGMHRGADFVARALAAGAVDYVPVDRVESDLAPAVRAAALTSD